MAGSIFNDRVSLAGGAFNNWLDKDQPNSFGERPKAGRNSIRRQTFWKQIF
jgi:hypothetical protein